MNPIIPLSAEQIAHFHERGYLRLESISTPEEVEHLRGIFDRLFAGDDARPLVIGRQKIAGIHLRSAVGQVRRDDHERRQILIECAEAIADPRTHAGESWHHEPGVLHVTRGPVDVRLRRHRHQKCHVIDTRGKVGEHAADPAEGFALALE